jgi:precorrin-6B methylase 2
MVQSLRHTLARGIRFRERLVVAIFRHMDGIQPGEGGVCQNRTQSLFRMYSFMSFRSLCVQGRVALLLVVFAVVPIVSWGQEPDSTGGTALPYRYQTQDEDTAVPYVSTPQAVVDSMLSMAGVSEGDVVYDLGSGDGRIPIRAAEKYGARGVGIEIKPDLVKEARENARNAGVSDRVEFREKDLFEADIGEATVVTIYLLPSANLKLRPKLFRELAPGTRVVSHNFHMEEWTPERTMELDDRLLYFWRIPEEKPDFAGSGP